MQASISNQDSVALRVLRENPTQRTKRRYDKFNIPIEPGMTVLSALLYAKEKFDHSIAIRYSCRMAACGSCGMKINGLPRLACYTQVTDFGNGSITVEPLDNYPLVRDLVTDFHGFFSKHKSVDPYLLRRNATEQETSESEYAQTPRQLEDYLQFSYCIKCGLCNAACPTMATDPNFVGPQALGQAYRYSSDSRDEGALDRIRAVDSEHGIWRCHFAGACTFVCPKGVDPALAIQRMRRVMFSRNMTKRKGTPILAKPVPKSG
jgi:succinate dehydrogenase / fumarate reductase iron-sulfur subunit